MKKSEETSSVFGIMAEFDVPERVLEAAEKAHRIGYREMDAYTPFPVDGLSEALGHHDNEVAWICFVGGLFGVVVGYGLQYYGNAILYPINVGGRPYNSWPAFIPITFECMVLFAALFAVFGMLWLNGLPRPYHPVFNAEPFQLASRNRFFLCIESTDKNFNPEETRRFLESLQPLSVVEVPS